MAQDQSWPKYIEAAEIEEGLKKPEKKVLDALTDLLTKAPNNLMVPMAAEGLTVEKIKGSAGLDPAPLGVLTRTLEHVAAAKRIRAAIKEARAVETARQQASPKVNSGMSAASSPAAKEKVERVSEILGGVSANEMAESLAKATKTNVKDMLKSANVENLPFHIQPADTGFAAMAEDARIAQGEHPSRFQYTYVNLQDKAFRLQWMGEELVGVRDAMDSLSANMDVSGEGSLLQVSKELEKLRKPYKLFRNLSHWQLALARYSIVAVGAKQWTWECHFAHIDLVTRLAEQESIRYGNLGPYIPCLARKEEE